MLKLLNFLGKILDFSFLLFFIPKKHENIPVSDEKETLDFESLAKLLNKRTS